MIQQIIAASRESNLNILIVSAPRSGTHVLGAEIAILAGAKNFGEICKVGYCDDPWQDLNKFLNFPPVAVAQIVQLTPKLKLAENVDKIKERAVIVNLRRKNKVDQFASWMYFRVKDLTGLHGWHNHTTGMSRIPQQSIEATSQDIDLFKIDQMIDDFFLPNYSLYYDDLVFGNQSAYTRNSFSFPLKEIFSNLDYVEQELEQWKYSSGHLYDNQ